MLYNSSSHRKIVPLFMIVLMLVVGFYFYFLRPQLDIYGDLKDEVSVKRKQLVQARTIINSYSAEKEKMAKIREELDKFAPLFREDFRQGLALFFLGMQIDKHNINIINLEPEGVVNRAYYLELPVKLYVVGTFENVQAFLGEIEGLPNPVQVCFLQIKPAGDDGNSRAVVPETVVEMQCRLVIYSDTAPAGQFHLEQGKADGWPVGRENPFSRPDPPTFHRGVPVSGVTMSKIKSGDSHTGAESDAVDNVL